MGHKVSAKHSPTVSRQNVRALLSLLQGARRRRAVRSGESVATPSAPLKLRFGPIAMRSADPYPPVTRIATRLALKPHCSRDGFELPAAGQGHGGSPDSARTSTIGRRPQKPNTTDARRKKGGGSPSLACSLAERVRRMAGSVVPSSYPPCDNVAQRHLVTKRDSHPQHQPLRRHQ